MKFILGTKQNMTEYFTEEGMVVPVTIVSAGPVTVTRVLKNLKTATIPSRLVLVLRKRENHQSSRRTNERFFL